MIKTEYQLKLKLLEYSDTERLERHAQIEIAFSQANDKIKQLEKALKQSEDDNASLRHKINKIIKKHLKGKNA